MPLTANYDDPISETGHCTACGLHAADDGHLPDCPHTCFGCGEGLEHRGELAMRGGRVFCSSDCVDSFTDEAVRRARLASLIEPPTLPAGEDAAGSVWGAMLMYLVDQSCNALAADLAIRGMSAETLRHAASVWSSYAFVPDHVASWFAAFADELEALALDAPAAAKAAPAVDASMVAQLAERLEADSAEALREARWDGVDQSAASPAQAESYGASMAWGEAAKAVRRLLERA